MRLNPAARPHMEAIAAIANFDPILCEVSESVAIANDPGVLISAPRSRRRLVLVVRIAVFRGLTFRVVVAVAPPARTSTV
jgi:hypothetical protein